MDITIARYVENRVQRHSTSSRLGATRMRADCLCSGQIGMGFWEARYLFIEKSIPYVPALSQWLSTPPSLRFVHSPMACLQRLAGRENQR
jgi:hypothetical protein